MTKYTTLVVVSLTMIFSGLVSAQDIQLRASVNKSKVGMTEQFQYTVEVSGQSTNLPTPRLPNLDEFNILSGPNTSNSIQFVNGKVSATKSYSYYLQPKKVGTFKVEAAEVDINDQTIRSNEIDIEVVKGSSTSQPSTTTPKSSSDPDILGESIYLKSTVSRRNVYQNEPVIVQYKLYFKVNVRRTYPGKQPAYPGFWTEKFDLPSQPPVETEIVNGVSYNVATIEKVALFPTRSGELEIDPLTITVDAVVQQRRRSRSLFDDFFNDPFGRTVRQTVSTEPVKIRVKPLPAGGKPASFNGAVGKYSFALDVDKTELTVNEATSIMLRLSGEGNIKLLDPPELQLPPDMEVYEPKEKTTISRDKSRITGMKSIEYVIVPRFEGEYTLKPVQFSYFDTGEKKYKTLKSESIKLSIQAGSGTGIGVAAASGISSRQEVALLGEDIRFIKDQAFFSEIGTGLSSQWWYWIVYLIPVIGIFLAWNYGLKREKLRSDLNLARRRKAGKIAARHLVQARKSINENGSKEFYKLVSQALQGFVSDRLNLQMTDFNASTVEENLTRVGVNSDEIVEYQACLQESDFRQFAATENSGSEMHDFYNRAKAVLTKLEKYI
jgi:hypothetical protein